MTSPHSNAFGLYYLPFVTIAHETTLTNEEASKAMLALERVGFAYYDADTEFVWVIEMVMFQIGLLHGSDKRIAGANKEYQTMVKNPFMEPFFDKYSDMIGLKS